MRDFVSPDQGENIKMKLESLRCEPPQICRSKNSLAKRWEIKRMIMRAKILWRDPPYATALSLTDWYIDHWISETAKDWRAEQVALLTILLRSSDDRSSRYVGRKREILKTSTKKRLQEKESGGKYEYGDDH